MLKIVWTLTPLFSLWKVKYIQLASINSIAKWTIVLAWHSIKSSILPPFACNLLFMHDLFAFSNLSLLKCPVWGSNSRPSDYETDALPTALTRLLCKLRVQLNVLLQWHSRLARRTYMSVSTKKCEGREFEPPLEQAVFLLAKVHPSIYQQFTIIIYMHWHLYDTDTRSTSRIH